MTGMLAAALLCSGANAYSSPDDGLRLAEELYRKGLYDEARTLFEAEEDNPMADGYVVLCALKTRSVDYETLMGEYERRYGRTILTGAIRLENARLIFDQGRYAEAALEFSKVESSSIPSADMPEYVFKCAYCEFALGRHQEALQLFTLLEALNASEYNAPGRYLSGVIHYDREDFATAEKFFLQAASDPRFKDLAEFYIVDC